MEIASDWKDYKIIDASNGEKLENWAGYKLLRPDPQIIWDNGDLLKKYNDFKALEDSYPELFRLARKFEGTPRNMGVA